MATTTSVSARLPRPQRLRGVVVRAGKMRDTITVLVERLVWHPKLRKQYRRSKRYLVHDPRGDAAAGDVVVIEQTRPISKRKHFRVFEVLGRDSGGNGKQEFGERATHLRSAAGGPPEGTAGLVGSGSEEVP